MSSGARQAVALVLATVLGVVAGGIGEHLRMAHATANPMDANVLLAQMDARLNLSTTQHDSIAHILARHQAALDAAWRATRPEVDSAQMEIVSVLTPDQRGRYMQWMRLAHRH